MCMALCTFALATRGNEPYVPTDWLAMNQADRPTLIKVLDIDPNLAAIRYGPNHRT